MKCFVIAMKKEAEPILSRFEITRELTANGKQVIYGNLLGKPAGLIICGVGKVNAACGTQYAIDVMGADSIINVGVAGGLNSALHIGGVYAVSAAVQYDFDLTQLNGGEIGTLDECSTNYIPLSISSRYPLKKLATGDRFNDSVADYNLLTNTLAADIRDMECGAIAQTCMHAGVKCLSYKIISDIAGSGSTTEQYLKNLKICFESIKRELENLWEEING